MTPAPLRQSLGVMACVAAIVLPAAAEEPFHIEQITPSAEQTGVSVEGAIQAHTSAVFDPSTLTEKHVRLLTQNGAEVSAHVTGDLGGVITISPNGRLNPYSRYIVTISDGVRSDAGEPLKPFRSAFQTGALPVGDDAQLPRFNATVVDKPRGATAVALGPDHRLYLANWEGDLFRYDIDPASGKTHNRTQVWDKPGGRIIGLGFDPDATAERLDLWVTYDDRAGLSVDDTYYTGVVSRLRMPQSAGQAEETKYITHLPNGDHPVNQFAFGPDGKLYLSIGAMTMLGVDNERRYETVLSASVASADVRSPDFNGGELPLNADTRGANGYDPYAEGAGLKLFATGIREAYDLCWHSNGQLYAGVNMNDTAKRSPESDRAPSIAVRPDEPMLRVVEGAYYGQPNPVRDEYVVQGGNPTAGKDPWEITKYPVGVMPNSRFDPSLLIYNLATVGGPSANGSEEWLGAGPLRGRMLICFYTATRGVHTFAFSEDGKRVTAHEPLRNAEGGLLQFGAPLDIAIDHPAGRAYVADFADPRRGDSAKEGALWVIEPIE